MLFTAVNVFSDVATTSYSVVLVSLNSEAELPRLILCADLKEVLL